MSTTITFFSRLTEPRGQRVRTTWEKLLERLSTPRVVSNKHDAPGISFTTYEGDRRSLANVQYAFAVGLDLDHLDALPLAMKRTPGLIVDALTWADLTRRFDSTDSFLHTTWSSTDEAPRARVFLRLSRPVTAEEYRRVYIACARTVESGGMLVDRAASDPSRFWFLPSVPPGREFRYSIGRGRAVNVEGALRDVPPPPWVRPPKPYPLGAFESPTSLVSRARAYLAKHPPAISGSNGHNTTFVAAQKLVRGFGLDEAAAFDLLCEWNQRCEPPWSEHQLRRKLHQAAHRGFVAPGSLRDRRAG